MRFVLLFLILFTSSAGALEYDADLEELINTDMKAWARSETVVEFLKARNERNADLSESNLKRLNSKWQSEKRKLKKPLTESTLSNELSKYLQQIKKDGQGVYIELMVIDSYALTAGQSDDSLNYWHVGEPRWEKTLGSKSYSTYISDLHFSDNSELFQVNVAFTIFVDELPIGVAYAGVDVEQLENWRKRKDAF